MNMGLNKFYDDSIDPECKKDDQKTYLLLRCDYILDKLRKHNLKLYDDKKHFINICNEISRYCYEYEQYDEVLEIDKLISEKFFKK